MATLRDLVTVTSSVTGIPEATIFGYGRFARQTGFIGQKGRGKNAAAMSLGDAANLLIAVGGASVTREAGPTIKAFRQLKNGRVYNYAEGSPILGMLGWLSVLGIGPDDEPGTRAHKIRSDFGAFFEFLLRSILNGSLAKLFASMPSAETPEYLWHEWQRTKHPNLNLTFSEIVRRGDVKCKASTDLEFGEDIALDVIFSRLVPAVEIRFMRMWDNSPQVVFEICFGPNRGARAHGTHHLRLEGTISQHALAAAALLASDKAGKNLKRIEKTIDWMFWNQFQPENLRDRAYLDAEFV